MICHFIVRAALAGLGVYELASIGSTKQLLLLLSFSLAHNRTNFIGWGRFRYSGCFSVLRLFHWQGSFATLLLQVMGAR